MTTPSIDSYRIALETYLDAKDNNRAQRVADVFLPDAVLTFSLATRNITFPARAEGTGAVAKTLVSDFNAQYAQCRTYYVCDALAINDGRIDALPWLVAMREAAAGSLRVGHGVYRWRFANDESGQVRVAHLHIYIARMDVVPDQDARLLAAMQETLIYPWLTPARLHDCLQSLARQVPALAFIEAFSVPASFPVEHS